MSIQNIEKICVSFELAMKLKELDVKQKSLFKWCNHPISRAPWIVLNPYNADNLIEPYSAFTASELGEMLPYYNYELVKSFRFYDFSCDSLDVHVKASNEADARAKMLIYLIEKKIWMPTQ